MQIQPTEEQQQFLELAQQGHNVLVNACIGSGKTTAIQAACDLMPGKKILYLTYNRRLMQEARTRIDNPSVDVHTYHSFAGTCLARAGINSDSIRDVPEVFVRNIRKLSAYDTVIVDEYQDLQKNLADMLVHICRLYQNDHGGATPQFLVVGDVDQKIYDYTRFVADDFMRRFLERLNGGYEQVAFTTCFRLSAKHAADLGEAWGKSIIGKNGECLVRVEHNMQKLVNHLAEYKPNEILVLGSNNGVRPTIQNMLEAKRPRVFNKETVYSSVADGDASMSGMDTSEAAIFTTYDSAKGLERDICVVCNFTEQYLDARCRYSTSREVLKNLFLVAASRGKKEIIFFIPSWQEMLPIEVVGNLSGDIPADMRPTMMANAFNFKKLEDLDRAVGFLRTKVIRKKEEPIEVTRWEGLIDLSSSIIEYVQARFFTRWDVDQRVDGAKNDSLAAGEVVNLPFYNKAWPAWRKTLYLTALETGQERYFKQVTKPYVKMSAGTAITKRLRTVFSGDEEVNVPCSAVFKNVLLDNGQDAGDKALNGYANVRKDGDVYELKFAEQLQDEHRLQAALYAVAMGLPSVKLWNLYDNAMEEVSVTDEAGFMQAVCNCVSDGLLNAGSVRLPASRGGARELKLSRFNKTQKAVQTPARRGATAEAVRGSKKPSEKMAN